jgi:hypothetical protein
MNRRARERGTADGGDLWKVRRGSLIAAFSPPRSPNAEQGVGLIIHPKFWLKHDENTMRLPVIWPWKRTPEPLVPLEPLLAEYPLYDPPHKVEERVLPKEQAQENFDYFLRVRQERVAFLTTWLRAHFGVTLTPDQQGVAAMNKWMVQYGGLLLPNETVSNSYFSYDPPWTGEGAGCNVLFDLATTFGEFLIANCPNLHWEMGPIPDGFTKREFASYKTDFGSGFQRPVLTGFKLRRWHIGPHHYFWMYASKLRRVMTSAQSQKFFGPSGVYRNEFIHQLDSEFAQRLDQYRNPEILYQGPVPDDTNKDDDND